MGRAINDEHPVFEWLIEHAGWLITHLRIGADGKTAWERVTGRPCMQPLVEFGEVVWAKPLRRSAGNRHKANLEARWFKGIWVGASDRSNEYLVICKGDGPAVKVRTIRRFTEASRWNHEMVDKVRARPRKPDPDGRGGDRDEDIAQDLPEDVFQSLDPEINFSPDTPGAVPEVPDGAALRPGRIFPNMPERRNFRITRKLDHEYGATENCPGCRFALGNARGNGGNPMHTPDCRQRFADAMAGTVDGRRRMRARDVRHGLAEEVEEDAAEAASEAEPEAGEDQEEQGEDHGEESNEPRAEPQDGRRVRRRVDPQRGVRRPRDEGDQDDDEPPHASQRVGAIEKAIGDIISVRHDHARDNGLESHEKCTREAARKMIEDLDGKHARKLKTFRDECKNSGDKVRTGAKGISEACSPPRMVQVAPESGLKPQWSFDMTIEDRDDGQPWDFNIEEKRRKAARIID